MKMKGDFYVTMGRGRNLFWGILFLLGAVAFLASKLGFLEGIGFWPILFSIGLIGILINGLVKRDFGQILFSLAFLVIVNDEFLNLEAITPWPVLGAAALGTIGLNFLFPRHHRAKVYRSASVDHSSGNSVFYENAFGSAVKYVVGEVSQVRVDNGFGSMEVYFSDAVLKDHRANVNINSSFGKVTLYVPRGWKVVNNTATAFGGMTLGYENDLQGEDTLYVSGDVSFGTVEIQYV